MKLAELVEYVVPVVGPGDGPKSRVGDGGKGESAKVDKGDVFDGDVVLYGTKVRSVLARTSKRYR